MCLTLKGYTGYLGHPYLHQEHRGVHEEQGRGFSCREGCFSRLFPVADSAKQEARLPTDLVPPACVRHSPLPCEQGKRNKTCPRPERRLGHDRGTDRNRRASDDPQDAQRDRQTSKASSSSERLVVFLLCLVFQERMVQVARHKSFRVFRVSYLSGQVGGCFIERTRLGLETTTE
jgi:hypothetical protein